jgi:phage terminase large subunit-like protein
MLNFKQIVKKYIDDVINNKIILGNSIRLTVERHLNDLKRKDIYFDEDAAIKFLKFAHLCRYSKGELAKQNKKIEFTPQQVFRYWCLFGWKNLDGHRRFRKVYFELARKNGKSEEAAIVCAYGLIADGEYGAEIYSVATKRDQAKIVFEAAREILRKLKRDSAKIDGLVNINRFNCSVINTNSKFEPLASDSDKQDGLSPHIAAVDEYHAHRDSSLLEVIETGMGSRTQPILLIITTAGFNKLSACYQLRSTALDILSGKKIDDSFFVAIFTLDEGDDWNDEKNWIKANPNIGITPRIDFLQNQYVKTKTEGIHKEVQFKTKNLNIWTDSSMAWIKDRDWVLCKGEYPDLTGKECYAGIDLAAVNDMNAFVLVFPIDGKIYVKQWFWIPEETAKRKNEIADYLRWVDDGFVTTAGDQVINQDIILRDILNFVSQYKLVSFAFDRFMAYNTIVRGLVDAGFSGFEHGQGYVSMSEPTKELEKMVLTKDLVHDNNPVMRWQLGNVEITIDAADNIKPDKGKSTQKIDGIVALIMAINCYMKLKGENNSSPYEERGIIYI